MGIKSDFLSVVFQLFLTILLLEKFGVRIALLAMSMAIVAASYAGRHSEELTQNGNRPLGENT